MAPARLAAASAAAALLFASASNFASAAPGGFLSYSDFAGTPYTVTYDNRRCVCARGAVCAGPRAIERAKGPHTPSSSTLSLPPHPSTEGAPLSST